MAVVLIRATILYIIITFSLRLMGKRQLGELQPSELVVTILISNIAAIPVEDSSVPMILGIVPIFTLVCLDVIVSAVMLKFPKFRKLMIGSPRVIMSEGVIMQKEMKRLRYTVDDLVEAMREEQIFDITEIWYAIVETTGKIHFLKKKDCQNAEKADVNCGGSSSDPPAVIIRDGRGGRGAAPKHGARNGLAERAAPGTEALSKGRVPDDCGQERSAHDNRTSEGALNEPSCCKHTAAGSDVGGVFLVGVHHH